MSLPLARLERFGAPQEASLAGRVVLVTGACGGLGSAVAHAAARAGATVVISGRRQRGLEKLYDAIVSAGGNEPVIHQLDLETATPQDYAAFADALASDLGRLDGVVHAAASFSGLTPLSLHQPDQWLRDLHVNVSAVFALTQACLPLLLQASDSALIFVLDDPERLRRSHWGAYGVSKAALERYVEILHDENDTGALRVHAVLPAPMRTALRREAYFGEDTMKHPLPDEAAAAVVHLLGAAAMPLRGHLLDLRNGSGT